MKSKNTLAVGAEAENKVKLFLVKEKYTILNNNFKTKFGEIDLIVKKDNFIRFVEVKKREYIPETLGEIIPEKKKTSLIRAANIYINKNNLQESDFIFEFDLIIINSKDEIEHFKNFFEV